MKKLIYLLFAITIIGCSSSEPILAEPILGVDNLSLVLKNRVLKYSMQVNVRSEYSFRTIVMEFKEDGKRNIFGFRGADGLPFRDGIGHCWNICGDGDSEIKIESPNYIEYIDGDNVTLIEGKLYFDNGYREFFDSSLQEIEDFKEEVQQVRCDGGCSS